MALLLLLDLLWMGLWFPLAARDRTLLPAELPLPPAPVLVLGAGVRPGKEPSPVLEERLKTALYLFQSGRAPWILVSGDNRSVYYNEPQAMRRWLIRQGVPPTHIVSDFAGRRTYDSLKRADRVFGVHRLTIVTSGFHVPRALYLASSMGLDARAVAASSREVPLRTQIGFWIREWAARHVALWDRWFPPTPMLGPREPTPEDYLK
nr:ElyC/SanA/YdcF family protein [uncultured Holophaga sp.]